MIIKPFTYRDGDGRKRKVEIIYRDSNWLAVNKPPALPVIPPRGDGAEHNLRDLLATQLRKEDRNSEQLIWVIHRIDRDTSGVVLFARNAEAHREGSRLFMERAIRKSYLAVLKGTPEPAEGEVNMPVRQHPAGKLRMQCHPAGKPSQTRYRVIESFRHYSLVELFPESGRTHQIRVHMDYAGCQLAIDPLYGEGKGISIGEFKRGVRHSTEEGEPPALISRLTLHAKSLHFDDPFSDTHLLLECALPRDMRALLNALERYDRQA